MPDRDRLAELRRQRALIQEHLAWLDREIEDVSGKKAAPLAAGSTPTPSPEFAAAIVAAALKAQNVTSAEPPAAAVASDSLLEEYRVPPETLKTDIRKGCFLYFGAAVAFVAVVVTILYFALRSS